MSSRSVDHEENVVAYLTNRLHADFTVLATIVRSLKGRTREDASRIFEAETSFFESAAVLASSYSKSIVQCTL